MKAMYRYREEAREWLLKISEKQKIYQSEK